jgi:hypothetical protein
MAAVCAEGRTVWVLIRCDAAKPFFEVHGYQAV